MKKLLLLFCLIGSTAFAQVQPQFRFYLAFEDATGARDTAWIILDQDFPDSFLANMIPYDSNSFEVGYGGVSLDIINDSVRKTISSSIGITGSVGAQIFALNYKLPLTIYWDTSFLKNHELPFELQQAWLESDNFLYDERVVNLFEVDSAELPEFTIGGGQGDHFPLRLVFSEHPFQNDVGIDETNSLFKIFPNPCINELIIEHSFQISSYYRLLNREGICIKKGALTQGINSINLASIASGVYFLLIENSKTTSYEPIIIVK